MTFRAKISMNNIPVYYSDLRQQSVTPAGSLRLFQIHLFLDIACLLMICLRYSYSCTPPLV